MHGKKAKRANGNQTPSCAPNCAGANLYDANLPNANLNNANLAGANLAGANLTGAVMTDAQLVNANVIGVTWSNTTCPNGTVTSTGCSNQRLGWVKLALWRRQLPQPSPDACGAGPPAFTAGVSTTGGSSLAPPMIPPAPQELAAPRAPATRRGVAHRANEGGCPHLPGLTLLARPASSAFPETDPPYAVSPKGAH